MNRVSLEQAGQFIPGPHKPMAEGRDFADALREKPEKQLAESFSPHAGGRMGRGSRATKTPTFVNRLSDVNTEAHAEVMQAAGGVGKGFQKPSGAIEATISPAAMRLPSSENVTSVAGPDPILPRILDSETQPIGVLSGDVLWSRVYPAHLLATGYLSVIDMTSHDTTLLSAATPPGRVNQVVAESVASPAWCDSGFSLGDTRTALLDFVPTELAVHGDRAVVHESRREAESPHCEPTSTLLADENVWAESLFRMVRDGDKSAVWLRDFGLKEYELEPVVAKLRRFGHMGGLEIGRIVINGHEIWRAASQEREN